MEHREAVAIVFLLLLHSLFVLLYENALAKRVSALKERLNKLKSLEGCDVIINEKAPLEVQITEIEQCIRDMDKMPEYISERIVNIGELEELIRCCYMQAQMLQKKSSYDERLLVLIKNLKQALEFEFRIEHRKIESNGIT